MLLRPVLLVLLIALLLVACRPTPSDPIEYLHREDSIIIQMLSVDAESTKFKRLLAVPEFTLYGDGTLIYQSVSADGTRLLETTLPEDAVQELLESIVDEGFLDFLYEQSAPESASSVTTFIYAHTRERANAVSIRGAAGQQEDDEKEYRSIQQIVATLRALDPVALGGSEPTAYVAEHFLLVEDFDGSGQLTETVDSVDAGGSIRSLLGSTLEDIRGPIRLAQEGSSNHVFGHAPLLPFYENFPEFDLQ